MRRILGEIQDGSFARELVEEFDAGKPNFLKRREEEHNEQIEQVGAKLRPLMSWLDQEDEARVSAFSPEFRLRTVSLPWAG